MKDVGHKSKPTLEQLLQLKRSERPPQEFWPQFEQELRMKQLAALVQPAKPWWQTLIARRLVMRVYAPLGAAAVVAFSLSLQQQPRQQVAVAGQLPLVAGVPVHAASPMEDAVAAIPSHAGMDVSEVPSPAGVLAQAAPTQSRVPDAEAEPVVVSKDPAIASAEQFLAAGTATVVAAGQVLAQVVGLTGAEGETDGARSLALAEPLAQLATPRDNRRTRLLASYVAYDPHAAGSRDSARSRDRIARRISDDSIYDQISRLGVSGDRVSIKF